jgi:hypothetical protein
MNKVITPEIRDVMEAVHYRPAVSLILPFHARISLKKELAHSLKTAADKVEKELLAIYPEEISMVVINKLRKLIKELKYESDKKSIAIYVSPIFQKVIYLDIPVEEKIIIDESFEIRDLLYSKKQLHKYLVLLLSPKESRMYLGNFETFIRIVSDIPESVYPFVNDAPEKVENFSDMTARREILMEKFLSHIDAGLDSLLKAYDLPLFVLGTERILGHFKKLSKHAAAVVEYVQGNYEEAGVSRLKELMKSHVSDWQKKKQSELLNIIEHAADRDQLVYGMSNVWVEVMNHKGRLLIVEKDYMYAAARGAKEEEIVDENPGEQRFSTIKDAVDDVIELLLKDGGDVEFVEKDVLKDYQQIALVKYY